MHIDMDKLIGTINLNATFLSKKTSTGNNPVVKGHKIKTLADNLKELWDAAEKPNSLKDEFDRVMSLLAELDQLHGVEFWSSNDMLGDMVSSFCSKLRAYL